MRDRAGLKFAALGLCAAVACGTAQQIPIQEVELENGMRLLLVERHNEPRVAAGWVAKVGSANERPGITGIAHLFEHMMFKGTRTIGSRNPGRDLEIIREQEAVREQMRQEERKLRQMLRRGEIPDMTNPEHMTARWRELNKRFRALVEEQRQLLVKNEFSRIYTEAGASRLNAFTSEDMTVYFVTVPANKLELWMWMESERILHPVFREFYAEREVVMEERRMRVESTPLGRHYEQLSAMFWNSHPYKWPVIGWPSDLMAISKADADAFYATYYSPQNIALVLVGDFEPRQVLTLARKYFGRIPRGRQDPPDVVTLEVESVAEKRMYAQAECNPQVEILWHTVGFGHQDSYALNVLAQLLTGRSGRLHKELVLKQKIATGVWAGQSAQKWAGFFNIGAEVKDGATPEQVESAIHGLIAELAEVPVPEPELQKVKNQFMAAQYRRLEENFEVMLQLLINEGLGDWREVNAMYPKIEAVTAADVQQVVRRYFRPENRTVAIFTRKQEARAN